MISKILNSITNIFKRNRIQILCLKCRNPFASGEEVHYYVGPIGNHRGYHPYCMPKIKGRVLVARY